MSALPPLVSLEQLEAWLAMSFDDAAQLRAGAVLDFVSGLIRGETRPTTWVEADLLTEVPPEIVGLVLIKSAALFRNPEGYVSETLGDYSYRLPDGGALLSDDERSLLARYRGTSRPGLWTQPLTRDGADLTTVYAPTTDPYADPIPMLSIDEAAW